MRALFPPTLSMVVKVAGHWVHAGQPHAFAATLRTLLLAG